MSLGSWRVGVRIARRAALRSKGRTLLIAAMVGVPITGLVAADTLFRTAQLSQEQQVERRFGQADFVAADTENGAQEFTAWPLGRDLVDRGKAARRGLASVRATGAAVVPFDRGFTTFRSPVFDRESAEVRVTDLRSPLVDGAVVRRTGELPAGPDEAVATPALLELAGASVGDTVTFQGSTAITIVGTAVQPSRSKDSVVFVEPGNALLGSLDADPVPLALIGATSEASNDEIAVALSGSGLAFASRESLVEPTATPVPPEEVVAANADEIGTGVVVVGLAALQIILLASAAFAVGARRQRRDLGLVAAQGGERGHVRSVVLASALVIGTAASVAGVGLGLVIAALARRPIENLVSELFGPFEVAPPDLLVIVAIGVVTALLAAAVPARTASRMPVLAALTGRRGAARTSRRVTLVALTAVVVGFVVAGKGAQPLANYNLILAGAVIAELGFALCAPAIVGLGGRVAQRFPVTLRLAFRDNARNRGRSGPAVAAIMAALAATVGLSVFLVSDDQRSEDEYRRYLPANVMQAYSTEQATERVAPGGRPEAPRGLVDDPRWPEARKVIERAMPGVRSTQVRYAGGCDEKRTMCTAVYAEIDGPEGFPVQGGLVVADVATIELMTGRTADASVGQALDVGKAVVLAHGPQASVRVVVERGSETDMQDGTIDRRESRIPAIGIDGMPDGADGIPPLAIVSAETAKDFHSGTKVDDQPLFFATHAITDDDVRSVKTALKAAGFTNVDFNRDRGYQSDLGILLLALVGVSTLVTVGATAIATGLAGVESRPDLATLAAVGASPRIRRTMAMAQAASVALTGALLGVLAGLIPAYAVLDAREDYPFVVPWGVVALVVVAVPTVAALLAGLFTRSRLPMNARIE